MAFALQQADSGTQLPRYAARWASLKRHSIAGSTMAAWCRPRWRSCGLEEENTRSPIWRSTKRCCKRWSPANYNACSGTRDDRFVCAAFRVSIRSPPNQ